MKKVQIRLSNKVDQKIELSLEPEGTIVDLMLGQSILLEISGGENPALDLQINKENGQVYIAIWPEYGKYEFIEQQ